MMLSLPLDAWGWVQPRKSSAQWILLSSALLRAIVRHFHVGGTNARPLARFSRRGDDVFGQAPRRLFWLSWVVLLAASVTSSAAEERLQRFTNLQDTEAVMLRLEGSINIALLRIAGELSLGNGNGGRRHQHSVFLTALLGQPHWHGKNELLPDSPGAKGFLPWSWLGFFCGC